MQSVVQNEVAVRQWRPRKNLPTLLGRLRFSLIAVSLTLLLYALWGGLLRLGWNLPWLHPTMALAHGPLMVCGFLGTLISLERAVALDQWWAYLSPFFCAIGSVFLAFGDLSTVGIAAIFLGSVGLIAIFAEILRRQLAIFTLTMALGAVAWSVGNFLLLRGTAIPSMVQWWIGFFVLTIVGERLELSRFLSPVLRGKYFFFVAVCLFFTGLVVTSASPILGEQIAGVGMILMAAWLARFDIARFTIKRTGLARFSAVCLIGGYGWLGVGGALWFLNRFWSQGYKTALLHYDVLLHTIFLGFVFSMIFAHAAIIFPAITGRALAFHRIFYSHAALLHLSLLMRVAGDLAGSYALYRWGGLFNVVAVLLFVANSAFGIVSGRKRPQTRASVTAGA